ncbi:N-acetylneuraminate synthase [Desulfobacula phenolica]|uniref:N-acetylneuraminate synthase n=1 Tax=Desulfobacula phenolica TaxID=90732 RepID=A0A1H2DRZ9_9BACT|nr:N-acetylneuraminate synthase [Desulfobacula phenolica]SDT85655.1 N-acetylneuraminate synthase [Desulfobacula phenolica]
MNHDKVFIIAEAGVNHNGSLDRAREMVEIAANAGADAVKFQTFKAKTLVTKSAVKADYQKKTSAREESQFDMLKKLELSHDAHLELINTCRLKGIEFLSSPFDLETIDLLKNLKIARWKIPSGEITNLPYLRKIASFGQEIILSTGMADLEEIKAAVFVFKKAEIPLDMITVLHCNTEYPTPMQDVNLNAMQTIKDSFPGVKVGYSDHTKGIEIPIAAVAMGATMIEKHFTLDKHLPGPDHNASLLPDELTQMVRAVRNIEMALGNGIKKPSRSEKKNIPIARKSIVAACRIAAGESFTKDNLTVKRPGTGISPMKWDDVIGGEAGKNYKKDDLIDA